MCFVSYTLTDQVRLWRTESSLKNGKQGELAGVEQLGSNTGSLYCIVSSNLISYQHLVCADPRLSTFLRWSRTSRSGGFGLPNYFSIIIEWTPEVRLLLLVIYRKYLAALPVDTLSPCLSIALTIQHLLHTRLHLQVA